MYTPNRVFDDEMNVSHAFFSFARQFKFEIMNQLNHFISA